MFVPALTLLIWGVPDLTYVAVSTKSQYKYFTWVTKVFFAWKRLYLSFVLWCFLVFIGILSQDLFRSGGHGCNDALENIHHTRWPHQNSYHHFQIHLGLSVVLLSAHIWEKFLSLDFKLCPLSASCINYKQVYAMVMLPPVVIETTVSYIFNVLFSAQPIPCFYATRLDFVVILKSYDFFTYKRNCLFITRNRIVSLQKQF